jgi:uncharacterized protein YcbX
VRIAELWRYPVKSMAGERLLEVVVGPLGLTGDRLVHARRADGRVATARTFPGLLGHKGTLAPGGEPLVDGRPWDDPSVAADVARIVGPGSKLVRDESADRFDVLPLLVATDGAIKAFGYDGRRLRPNLVIAGVDGLDERAWEGRHPEIGGVVIAIQDLRGRCVMTTFDPDTVEQDREVLESIVERFGGRLALNAGVVKGGVLRVGDPVTLV